MASTFSIKNTTKGKPPRLPFQLMKDKILGKRYTLSLVFIGSARSKKLNETYRKKNKPADVLSFPFSSTEGEVFIDLAHARKKAPEFGRTPDNFIGFLFIHGLLHLKGFDHGSTMEDEEEKFSRIFLSSSQ